jgi:hypothetical protein
MPDKPDDSPFDPNDVFLDPDDEDQIPPNRANRAPERLENQGGRLQLPRLPGLYARVPLQWLTNPCREDVFEPEARLFLYLLLRSRWGQRGVHLTNAVATEIRISALVKRRALGRLERKGWVRVERHPGHGAPTVWPIVISG